jgi:hypothetical protein
VTITSVLASDAPSGTRRVSTPSVPTRDSICKLCVIASPGFGSTIAPETLNEELIMTLKLVRRAGRRGHPASHEVLDDDRGGTVPFHHDACRRWTDWYRTISSRNWLAVRTSDCRLSAFSGVWGRDFARAICSCSSSRSLRVFPSSASFSSFIESPRLRLWKL